MREEVYQKEVYSVEIRRDPLSGVAVSEKWCKEGKSHREDGPAQITRDASTGTVVREAWIRNNKYHRTDGPAIILRHPTTEHVYFSAWYRNDEKISPPGRPQRGMRASARDRSASTGPKG